MSTANKKVNSLYRLLIQLKVKGKSFRAASATIFPFLFVTLIHSCYSKMQRPALVGIY